MRTFDLYLESGPQRKTTLVHVLELAGCVANGKTTDAALAATPEAIRAYLGYLRRHGEPVDPAEPFATRVAAHLTKGQFLGQGSPQATFEPDLRPLTPKDLERSLRWAEWSRADLLALVDGLDARERRAKPPRARAIDEILAHVLGADKGYVYAALGPVAAVGARVKAALRGTLDVRVALAESRAAALEALRRLTPERRRAVWRSGASTRTARRMIRRMLEHEWEHRREIASRLGREA